jgi:hypothetical protein
MHLQRGAQPRVSLRYRRENYFSELVVNLKEATITFTLIFTSTRHSKIRNANHGTIYVLFTYVQNLNRGKKYKTFYLVTGNSLHIISKKFVASIHLGFPGTMRF